MSGGAIDPVLPLILRAALALLFGWSAFEKLRDVDRFRAALEGYRLLPPRWTIPGGAALIAGEIGVTAGLCLPRVGAAAAVAAAGLLLLYGGAMAVNLARGRRDIDCGCGGPAGRQGIGPTPVIRNALLAAGALLSVLPAQVRALTWVDWITVAGGVSALALLYVAADGLLSLRGATKRRTAAEALHA